PEEKQKLKDKINRAVHQHIDYNLELQQKSLQRRIEEAPKLQDRNLTASQRKKVQALYDELETLTEKRKKLHALQDTPERPYFLWHLFFADVFEQGGFDIVIGNPPYIQLQRDGGLLANLYKDENYATFDRMGDIYMLFYEIGMLMLRQGGVLTYITSNKWMRAGYGKKLRQYFLQFEPLLLIDLGPGVFENATVDTNILLIKKNSPARQPLKAVTLTRHSKEEMKIEEYMQQNAVVLEKLSVEAWFIGSSAEQRLKEKIERIGKSLKEWDVNIYYGIKTGLNDAFIISTEKRNEILANCKDKEERKRTEAIIKPILRGRDIKRYYYEWAGLWIIGTFPALRLNIDDYPALKKYFLDHFDKRQLEQSGKKYPQLGFNARKKTGNKWFETQDQIAYYSELEKEKVVWKRIGSIIRFALDTKGTYPLDSNVVMTGSNMKYICGFLNSKLSIKQLLENSPKTGTGDVIISVQALEPHRIPIITSSNKQTVKQIELLVDKILAAKNQDPQSDTSRWEREIDRLVYQLYELTEEEVRIVEGN
ncbi:MAG: Eco57I restriction-modification methylase domain-containing protein, partial [Chitinophagales bacterium]|nr:Eco57I restriction-modification methylase domain-containing protein [Chitinophagales bacterium]